MRRLGVAFLCGCGLVVPAAAQSPIPAKDRRLTSVTAVAQGLVYIAAGRNEGLREGAVVRVPRLGPAGRYVVEYLSSRSAACRGDSLAPLPAVGDSVEFAAARDPMTGVAGGAPLGTAARARSSMRGRVGIRYLSASERGSGPSTRQPGLELHLDGPIAPGSALAVSVDVRPRRTTTYRPGVASAAQGTAGVYQAAVRVQAPHGRLRAVLGRQYAPTLAGAGLFDGVLLDLEGSRLGAGLLAGFAPELGTLAVSSTVRQVGGFVRARSAPTRPLRWAITSGAMASYDGGEVNREFAFVQGVVTSRRVSAVVLQEVDINRGWKLDAGESPFVPTSTFLSLTLSPADGVALSGGLDNRRNVRLYRDLATPEELFDDRFRFGAWGGLSVALGKKLRVGGDLRTSTVAHADSLQSTAFSGHASLDRLTRAGLGARVRLTRYRTSSLSSGWLYAGALRIAPASIGSLELLAGRRSEETNRSADRSWAGLSADLALRRAWFGVVSFSREWGRDGLTPTTEQLYAGVSYRF